MSTATLFTPEEELERQQCVRDYIAHFRALLKDCRNKEEREALKVTIANWSATLEEPKPAKPRNT